MLLVELIHADQLQCLQSMYFFGSGFCFVLAMQVRVAEAMNCIAFLTDPVSVVVYHRLK